MPSVTLKAHYDGQAILLDEPYALPANARLLITLVEPEPDAERAAWGAVPLRSRPRLGGRRAGLWPSGLEAVMKQGDVILTLLRRLSAYLAGSQVALGNQ